MRIYIILVLTVLCIGFHDVSAVRRGSNNLVSVEPFATFPQSDSNSLLFPNRMEAFGWFKNGFQLENSTTLCTFNSAFPVSGTIDMNGGTLNLEHDLIMHSEVTLENLGTLVGAVQLPADIPGTEIILNTGAGARRRTIEFSPDVANLPSDNQVYQNVAVVLNSNMVLGGSMTFKGNCVLNGQDHIVDFAQSAGIIVDAGATLIIENIDLYNLSGTKISCVNNTSRIVLNDVSWVQNGNFTFSKGSLRLEDEVLMAGDGIFAYQSVRTSTISRNARVLLDEGFTFSYNPIGSTSQELINFENDTATLIMHGGKIHTARTGMKLLRGNMLVMRDSFLSSEVAGVPGLEEAIIIGNGIAADDFSCLIFGGVTLNVTSGVLAYNNASTTAWHGAGSTALLRMQTGTTLALYQSLDLGPGIVQFDNNTILARKPGKGIIGSIKINGSLTFVTI